MENYLMINGKRIDLTEEQIEILTDNTNKPTKDVIYEVNLNEEYGYIQSTFEVSKDVNIINPIDRSRFKKGNAYPKECYFLAHQDAMHDELRSRLRKFTRNHGWDENVWNDFAIDKWYIDNDKDSQLGTFSAASWRVTKSNDIYFMSKEIANQAIEEVIKPFTLEHPDFVW